MEEASYLVPPLYGLVLAGGKSQRMGHDKGAAVWHGKEQRYYMADLLGEFCQQVYISCRAEQQGEISSQYSTLPDTYTGMGPFGAILSAFKAHPTSAWLVVACDMPLLDQASVKELVAKRQSSALATTYKSPDDGSPEPLVTIWEPGIYPVLLSNLSRGYSSPKKVLINSQIKLLDPPHAAALMNVNTPEEAKAAKKFLSEP